MVISLLFTHNHIAIAFPDQSACVEMSFHSLSFLFVVQPASLAICATANLSSCFLQCLSTNLSAIQCAFCLSVCLPASSERSGLNGLSVNNALSTQDCPTADGPPSNMTRGQCASPSQYPSRPLCTIFATCSTTPLLSCSTFWPFSLVLPPSFLSYCLSPAQCPSFPPFPSSTSPPLPISPHQEEPNRKSKFLVEEWSGA